MVYKLKLKRKKFFPFIQTNSLPFPLTKTNEKIPALFNGFSVVIIESSYFGKIHNNGCYGKGSISRSAPRLLKKAGKDSTSTINSNETLVLDLEEAFFLTHFVNVLEIKCIKGEIIDDYELFNKFCAIKSNFIDSLVVYLYLKSNEWIIKSGIKFGANFLLYKGNVRLYHASFAAIIINADVSISTKNIQVIQRVAESADKDVMVLQIYKPNNLDLNNLNEVFKRLTDFKVQEIILKRFAFSKNCE